MKKVITSLLLAGSTLGVASIIDADILTGRSITDAYIAGQLEDRLQELGTNYQSREFLPSWRARQENGVKLHCARTLLARGAAASEKCGSQTRTRL